MREGQGQPEGAVRHRDGAEVAELVLEGGEVVQELGLGDGQPVVVDHHGVADAHRVVDALASGGEADGPGVGFEFALECCYAAFVVDVKGTMSCRTTRLAIEAEQGIQDIIP